MVRRNVMTSCSSVFTRAPITPRLVSLKNSKGLVFETVCRKGYKYRGICANRKADLVRKVWLKNIYITIFRHR